METRGFLLLIARHPLCPAPCSYKSRLCTGEPEEDGGLLEQRTDEKSAPYHATALKGAMPGNEAASLASWRVMGQCMW